MSEWLLVFVVFLPLVSAGGQESKLGYAPSTHTAVAERVAQMPETVRWYGQQLFPGVPLTEQPAPEE